MPIVQERIFVLSSSRKCWRNPCPKVNRYADMGILRLLVEFLLTLVCTPFTSKMSRLLQSNDYTARAEFYYWLSGNSSSIRRFYSPTRLRSTKTEWLIHGIHTCGHSVLT